jgi:hypothetical protein
MEKRLNTKFDLYIKNFKDGIRDKMSQLQMASSDAADLMEYIYEYDRLILDKEDFIKRKRVKNSIPENNRCLAKRATGEQCTRRRKTDCEFCGTHSKGTPHGLILTTEANMQSVQNIEVFAQQICGIVYYLDQYKNVYNTEDIMSSVENPRIIAKWERTNDVYKIPSMGLV